MSGSLFENFVVSEIIKSYYNVGQGCIICQCDKPLHLSDDVISLPIEYV